MRRGARGLSHRKFVQSSFKWSLLQSILGKLKIKGDCNTFTPVDPPLSPAKSIWKNAAVIQCNATTIVGIGL